MVNVGRFKNMTCPKCGGRQKIDDYSMTAVLILSLVCINCSHTIPLDEHGNIYRAPLREKYNKGERQRSRRNN